MEVRALFRVPSGIGAPSVFVVSASRSPAPPVRALCGFLRACRSHAGGSPGGTGPVLHMAVWCERAAQRCTRPLP